MSERIPASELTPSQCIWQLVCEIDALAHRDGSLHSPREEIMLRYLSSSGSVEKRILKYQQDEVLTQYYWPVLLIATGSRYEGYHLIDDDTLSYWPAVDPPVIGGAELAVPMLVELEKMATKVERYPNLVEVNVIE